MLATMVEHTIGIDPGRDWVTASVVDTDTTGKLASETFETTRAGYARMLEWANQYTAGAERAWVIEGTGSYGAGAAGYLVAEEELVVEFDHPSPSTRDGTKTDELDALRAARQVLGRPREPVYMSV